MKITNVRGKQPIADNSPPDWRTTFGQFLVAIDTDIGITGYGVGGGGQAGVQVVSTVLRDVLLDQDPTPIQDLWDKMYRVTLAFGRKGLAIMALSGVDLALYDLWGKAEKKPVAELLGGTVGQPIPTYVTAWDEISPDEADQYQAFKLHVGENPEEDLFETTVRQVSKARAVIGHDRPLMIDAWMKWDVELTLKIAKEIQVHRLDWIEEPISPDDLEGYAVLRDQCPVPIAGGEHEFTAIGFAPLIEQKLHQILQPDVCWCGGMTELIKIYQMAKRAGLRVCPHRGAEVWGLHALAALDPEQLAESGRPWMGWVKGQPEIVDGYIQLTDNPGFGIEIGK